MTTSTSRQFTVLLKDGSSSSSSGSVPIVYTLRGLASDSEIDTWSQFCASVFSYKAQPPPASYFARHYHNDPHRDASLIRVATIMEQQQPGGGTAQETIVASCRVFARTISNGRGGMLQAGGIGEVCTADSHRRRGLSKALLEDCIKMMEQSGMKVSLLHAAPAFFPVYQSADYACSTSRWSVVHKVQLSALGAHARKVRKARENEGNVGIRLAAFPEDVPTLQLLHQEQSEARFCGCIVRSEAYWNDYLSVELVDSLWVLEINNVVVAWLSVRPRGTARWQLREFGCRKDTPTTVALSLLMHDALAKAIHNNSDKEDSTTSVDLHIPTFLLDCIREERVQGAVFPRYWEDHAIEEENDEGWMYRPIGDTGTSMPDILLQSTTDGNIKRPIEHLIWPADSF